MMVSRFLFYIMLTGGDREAKYFFFLPTHEKAIAAYQFQVERYHTWMNYYSFFNGALLVAVYSLFDKEKESPFLLLILSIVGFVAGLCWLGSIVGNRYWMNSWLQIVKQETTVSSKSMYSSYYCKEGEEKYFLSTPVLTQLFISTVVCFGLGSIYIVYCSCLLEFVMAGYSGYCGCFSIGVIVVV